MDDFTFTALGTTWSITIDGPPLTIDSQRSILESVTDFENRFSRFIADSEVNQFRDAKAGSYQISKDLASLLSIADQLRTLTDGVYDPAVSELLERVGYDSKYTLKPSDDIDAFILPCWTIKETTLTLDGPTAFDLGGIGKGYCIDMVAKHLIDIGHQYFLVNGGGDMYGTMKKDETPWRIAIQYPGKPDTAAGIVKLKNKAIAVSDSFRRRWGKWHHLVDPKRKKAIEAVVGAVAVTPNAWHADCMTSALFFASADKYSEASLLFKSDFLVFLADDTCQVSSNWPDELF